MKGTRSKVQHVPDGEIHEKCTAAVMEMMPNIVRVAKKFKIPFWATFISVEDLVQEGCIAAFRCMIQFDESRCFLPWTYAFPRVRGAMLDFMRRSHMLNGNRRNLDADKPAVISMNAIVINHKNEHYEQGTLEESFASDDADTYFADDVVKHIMIGCDERERLIIQRYFFEDKTMRQIGKEINLSESRVSQCMAHILTKIRDRHVTCTLDD